MAWTAVDSLNPPKATNRLINETGKRFSNGACVVYRAVFTCIAVDGTDGYSLLNMEDHTADGSGTILVTVPFQAAGETVEVRFRSGLNFATGLGIDLTAGSAGDGQVMITKLFAQKKQA